MTENQRTRRRQLYIKKEFQFRFIVKFCLILLAGLIVSTGLLFAFSQDTLTSSFAHSRLVIQRTSQAMLPAIIYTNLITLALILVVTIVVTLYLSNRIAGPIFRLEKEIARIGEGDLSTPISLRSDDQMQEFARRVNDMARQLNRRVAEIQRQAEAIAEAAADASSEAQTRDRAEALGSYIRDHFTLS